MKNGIRRRDLSTLEQQIRDADIEKERRETMQDELEAARERQDAVLKRFPEVAYVAAKVARAETSTDPAGLNMTETIVHLKPLDQWPSGMTLAKLKSEMDRAVSLPGGICQ